MDSYEKSTISKPLETKPFMQMTARELDNYSQSHFPTTSIIPALARMNLYKTKKIAELSKTITNLEKRLAFLEEKTLKKAGRKKQTFYFNFQELTDDYLIHLIDTMHMTICELEKDVNAGKNVLRNRYNKAKKKQQLERQVKRNDNT